VEQFDLRRLDMSLQSILFYRDAAPLPPQGTPAILEYSWIPQGMRRSISLQVGEGQKCQTDSLPTGENYAQVQVYQVSSGGLPLVGLDNWQFPPGPPHNAQLICVIVELFMQRKIAVSVCIFSDGSTVTDFRAFALTPPTY
jgi:hypothetical protein